MNKSISRKNILRGAGAFLIIVLMILSSIVVTANTTNKGTRNIVGYEGFEDGVMPSAGWALNNPSSNRDITSSASMKIPENRDIIFTDDFNDNIKDYSKWTEIYTDGIWEEINQRAEFQCYESGDSSNRYEGIESSEFIVSLSSVQSAKISCDMMTAIGGTTSWVGQPRLRITDGTNWIEITYERWNSRTKYIDSNDADWTILEPDKLDGSWSNMIEIFSDRYIITMDGVSSGPIYDALFSSTPTLMVQIYIIIGGSNSNLYLRSGFDNVIVQGVQNQPPNPPIITGPTRVIPGTYLYTFTSTDPDGDEVSYLIQWGDGDITSWTELQPSGPPGYSESHKWNTQGIYSIVAKAKDVHGAESAWGSLLVVVPVNQQASQQSSNQLLLKMVQRVLLNIK